VNDLPFMEQSVQRIDELVGELAGPRGGLLVALSGGPDSVALLFAAQAWAQRAGRPLAAAHLNHRLRGPDADGDEQFCRDLCRDRNIELHVERRDPRASARRRGMGLEEAGRALRRRFLHDLLDGQDEFACAATGHHLDDQTETVIMRLFRGTGLDGLRGIRPRAGRIIHPLLERTRKEIIAFLEAVDQPYRIDGTNVTADAVRSRVRRELVPLAKDIFGSGCASNPARLAKLVHTDLACLDGLTRQALRRVVAEERDGEPASLLVEPLGELDRALARRVVRTFLAEQYDLHKNLELIHVDTLLDWLARSASGASQDLPGGWRAVRQFDRLRLLPRENDIPLVASVEKYRIVVQASGSTELFGTPPGTTPGPRRLPDGWQLICPAGTLSGRVRLRNWKAGDRIEQFGLGGHKKLSDLLQQHRIDSVDRPGVLVVEDDDGILWVVGIAQAERTRILPTTGSTVTISVIRRSEFAGIDDIVGDE